jgi:hypothetical protein
VEVESPWSGWSIVPETRKQLWDFIGNAAFDLGPNTRVAWRGLPDESYECISSLARELKDAGVPLSEENIRNREMRILDVARNWDIGLSEHGMVSDLHLLAMLQHHGAPTRLIDITYNPLTALWFACSDPESLTKPGVLVVVTVSDALRHTTSENPQLTFDTIDKTGSASLISTLRESRATGKPFIIEPRPQDSRMKAQEGAFIGSYWPSSNPEGPLIGLPYGELARMMPVVLNGVNTESMLVDDEWHGLAFTGIVSSPELKQELLPVLDHTFNRSLRTMYPDVPGFVSSYRTGLLQTELDAFNSHDHRGEPRWPEYWND